MSMPMTTLVAESITGHSLLVQSLIVAAQLVKALAKAPDRVGSYTK